MFDIFISYKSEERSEADYIRRYLEASGLTCWMDNNQLKCGCYYKEEISKIMPECRSLILLISYSSLMSKEVKAEFQLAKENGLQIFPLKIQNCRLSSEKKSKVKQELYSDQFKHIQIAKNYWKSSDEKLKILNDIRDKVYGLKGLPVKTDVDFLKGRIKYYQKNIISQYKSITENWNDTIIKSIEFCGFMTPQPHYINGILSEAFEPYCTLIKTYADDIVRGAESATDEMYMNTLEEFCRFVCNFNPRYKYRNKYDAVTYVWLPFKKFIETVKGHISIKTDGDEHERSFILRIYKDYLLTLRNDTFEHPIVILCDKLKEKDKNKFDILLSFIQQYAKPDFVSKASNAVYIHPRFIGAEYININTFVNIDERRNIFKPEDIKRPLWCDFIYKYLCDNLIFALNNDPGATTLINYFIDNSFFTCDEKFNCSYLYLIMKWIESGHPEYVKILLRNLDRKSGVFWEKYVKDPDSEIAMLKRFIRCCMYENGYELEDFRKIWVKA